MAVFGWEELGTNAVQMEMEPLRTEGVKQSREGGWTPRRTKNTGGGHSREEGICLEVVAEAHEAWHDSGQ